MRVEIEQKISDVEKHVFTISIDLDDKSPHFWLYDFQKFQKLPVSNTWMCYACHGKHCQFYELMLHAENDLPKIPQHIMEIARKRFVEIVEKLPFEQI